MIYNVFDFGDSVAKDIMVPRIDMTFVDVGATYEEVISVFREEKYTRYPVFEETTDNVIGIINIKDLLLAEPGQNFCLRDYLREPLYTYEFKKTTELMVELRKTQNNIAIGLELESEDYDSIGGFVIGLLDHLPEAGEEVTYQNLRFVVEKMDRNRIDEIHLYIQSKEDVKDEEI